MKNIKLFLTKLMVMFIAVFSVNSLAFAGNGFKYDPSGLELFKPENRELVKKLLEDGDNPNTANVFIELFHKEIGKKFLKIKKEEDGSLKSIKDKELSKQEIEKLTPLLKYIYDQTFESYIMMEDKDGKSLNLNKQAYFCASYVGRGYNIDLL